ncbi:putative F-box domain-containing protein [Medicago truncatula]|uniref:F-box protein n=1 Tax=Medicago truncatula TaxID=3880 RepID=G7L1N6_MEDTR|nr:F-box protein [Medicago truncatula]RHN48413.1 putative F-box domain-containing protein [Medicago truncatula]
MRWKEKHTLTNLPVDVFELILKRLPLRDCLGLRAICRSCRKTVSNVIENKHYCHLPELPLVFLRSKNSRFYYNLSTESVHHRNTLLWQSTHECLGSIEGWLIVGDFSQEGFAKNFFLNFMKYLPYYDRGYQRLYFLIL